MAEQQYYNTIVYKQTGGNNNYNGANHASSVVVPHASFHIFTYILIEFWFVISFFLLFFCFCQKRTFCSFGWFNAIENGDWGVRAVLVIVVLLKILMKKIRMKQLITLCSIKCGAKNRRVPVGPGPSHFPQIITQNINYIWMLLQLTETNF